MIGFIISAVVAAIAIAVTAIVLPSISYGDDYQTLAVVAVIFGLVNGFVKPIVMMLSLPLRMVTLGAIGFVINAALLLGVAWVADQLDYSFTVGGFPPDLSAETFGVAIIGAAIISIVTAVVGLVVRD
jgi:putative membrane protein